MKSTPRTSILILLLASASPMATAQAPDPTQLLREVQAKYLSLQSYSDVGEVRSTTTMSSSPGEAAKKHEMRSTFTIKLNRPQMYRIEWDDNSGFSKGSLLSDGESRSINIGDEPTHPQDTETAMAMATGVSGGAANTIPSVFFDLEANGIKAAENPVLSGEEAIEGDDCYVVKMHREHLDQTFWISKASKLIRQERMDMSGNFGPTEELTDADAKKVLESMGRKATDEAIQQLRKQMAQMQEMMKTAGPQSHSSIETHREIKTNDPMSAVDFREKPAGTVPK
jgi:outer membrane lipoprotein-sorting protein